jgi:hypothetical protein
MATTTNYGWTTPDDTALVKDGAAAIRTLGSSIDTTTKALNPSTTLGDIEYRSSTANTNTRLAIGSTGNILTVAGGVPTWAAPASAGGMTLLDTMSLSGSSVTSTTFSSSYKQLIVYVKKAYGSSVGLWKMRMNGNTGSVYSYNFVYFAGSTVYDSANNTSFYRMGYLSDSATTSLRNYSVTTISRPSDSDVVFVQTNEVFGETPSGIYQGMTVGNFVDGSAPITSITLFPNTGTFSGGEAFIYGVN